MSVPMWENLGKIIWFWEAEGGVIYSLRLCYLWEVLPSFTLCELPQYPSNQSCKFDAKFMHIQKLHVWKLTFWTKLWLNAGVFRKSLILFLLVLK